MQGVRARYRGASGQDKSAAEDGVRGEQNELASRPAEGIEDPLRERWCLRNDHPALTGDIRTAALSSVLVSLLGCREHGDV